MNQTHRRTRIAIVVAGLVFAGACDRERGSGAPAALHVRPTPPASFDHATVMRADSAAVAAYVATLRFRRDFAAADGQRVITAAGRAGPYVRIVPEIGSRELSAEGLAAGRIVAVVAASADDTTRGIRRGLNYIWVDRDGTPERELRAFIFSLTGQFRWLQTGATYMSKPLLDSMPASPYARISSEPGFSDAWWVSCTAGCCGVCMPPLMPSCRPPDILHDMRDVMQGIPTEGPGPVTPGPRP